MHHFPHTCNCIKNPSLNQLMPCKFIIIFIFIITIIIIIILLLIKICSILFCVQFNLKKNYLPSSFAGELNDTESFCPFKAQLKHSLSSGASKIVEKPTTVTVGIGESIIDLYSFTNLSAKKQRGTNNATKCCSFLPTFVTKCEKKIIQSIILYFGIITPNTVCQKSSKQLRYGKKY